MAHKQSSLDQKRARQALRQTPDEAPEFQIAPMIDVLLVLLVFFMSISSTQVLQVTKNVELPKERDGAPLDISKYESIVNITYLTAGPASSIEMNQRTYLTPDDLQPELQRLAAGREDYRVVVRADKHTQYRFLRKVLASIGQAGIRNVTFSVSSEESPNY